MSEMEKKDEDMIQMEKEMSDLMKKIFIPIILVLGIMGNLISIVIFSQNSLKKHTTFRYLFLLSIIDICVLVSGCGDILLQVYFEFNIRVISDFFCKVHSFMVIFFTHSSSMILLVMSIDRAVLISISNQTRLTSAKAIKKIFLAILLFITLLNLHFLLFNHLIDTREFGQNETRLNAASDSKGNIHTDENMSTSTGNENEIDNNTNNYTELVFLLSKNQNGSLDDVIENTSSERNFIYLSYYIDRNETYVQYVCYASLNTPYYEYLTVYNPWVDLFFYAMFPSAVMLACSIIIISKIIGANNRLSEHDNQASRRRNLRNKQISYLLLTTNFLFISLVAPILVLNLLKKIEDNTISTTIVYLLSYSNHSLNFIFYGITCEKYRHELFKLLNKLVTLRSDDAKNENNIYEPTTYRGNYDTIQPKTSTNLLEN